jgi:hypothetical protein
LAPIGRIFKSQINRENPDYANRMWLLIDAVDSRPATLGLLRGRPDGIFVAPFEQGEIGPICSGPRAWP